MACEQPCFDCPFLRFADKAILKNVDMIDYVWDYFTEEGGFQEIHCEEQRDICFGQIQVLANGWHSGLDPSSDLGIAVNLAEPNLKDFFKGPWEFMQHYEYQ